MLILGFGRSVAMKCVSINNPQYSAKLKLIGSNLNVFHHYPFIISMNRCDGSCNTLNDPLSVVCVPNKMEDKKLKVFDTIKEINESYVT